MPKIISICQPHFLPWIGYFKMISKSSKLIFLDNVQYNRRSWQNRVHIRSGPNINEKKFLSLHVKDNSRQNKINEIYLKEENKKNFLNNLKHTYGKCPYFNEYFELLKNIFFQNIDKNLADFNIIFIKEICNILNIQFNYDLSSKYNFRQKKEFLILEIINHFNADIYLSNLGSKNYVKDDFFTKNNVKVVFNEFEHPVYSQNLKNNNFFLKNLSIIDLLFNVKNPKKFFEKKTQ